MKHQTKSSHPLYSTWKDMLHRCNNPNRNSYQHYGGRNIKVCPEWEQDFYQFVADMGDKPTPQHSLDRINNDQGYSPDNCRWATTSEQQSNRRRPKRMGKKPVKGYSQTASGKYQAIICKEGRYVRLGRFECPLMARIAYEDALTEINKEQNYD